MTKLSLFGALPLVPFPCRIPLGSFHVPWQGSIVSFCLMESKAKGRCGETSGIPMSGKRLPRADFDPLISSVTKRIKGTLTSLGIWPGEASEATNSFTFL